MGGAPSIPAPTPQYQPASADLQAQNAALFERIQRSRAYGVSQTRLVKSTLGGSSKGTPALQAPHNTPPIQAVPQFPAIQLSSGGGAGSGGSIIDRVTRMFRGGI